MFFYHFFFQNKWCIYKQIKRKIANIGPNEIGPIFFFQNKWCTCKQTSGHANRPVDKDEFFLHPNTFFLHPNKKFKYHNCPYIRTGWGCHPVLISKSK